MKALVEHLISAAKQGYGKTRKQVNMTEEMVAISKGVLRRDKISNGWWIRFVECQPEVSLQRADSTAHIRMDSVNKEFISFYFDLLESTLTENSLIDYPGQIYNMDETGMPLDPRPPNIIATQEWPKEGQLSSVRKKGGDYCHWVHVEMLQVSPSLLWLFLRGNTLTTNGQWVKFLEPCMK